MFIRQITFIPRLVRHAGFATHRGPPMAIPAALHLKSGQSYLGRSFGAPKSIFGETVFTTSITSCEHVLLMLSRTLD